MLEVAGRAHDCLKVGLEEGLRENDEATLTLTEAARESGYRSDHLGHLAREGRFPAPKARRTTNRPQASPLADRRGHLTARLASQSPQCDVSIAQIVQSVIEEADDGTHETTPAKLQRR